MKNNIVKRILSIVIATLLLFTAAGCGNTGNTDKNSGEASATKKEDSKDAAAGDTGSEERKDSTDTSGSEATLRFSWWGGDERHEATLAVIEQYQNENTGISIEGEYSGWDGYLEKLTTQLAAGTAPDIIQITVPFRLP